MQQIVWHYVLTPRRLKNYRCTYNGERKEERDCVREKGGNDKEREEDGLVPSFLTSGKQCKHASCQIKINIGREIRCLI